MDELIKIKGIGAATAKKLVEAGLATVAALAAADPATPLEGVSAEEWGKWIASAKMLIANPVATVVVPGETPPAQVTPPAPQKAKASGPVANARVRFNGKLYEAKAQLPDLTVEEATELRRLKIID